MKNENGRQFPDGYYFDSESKDAVPESGAADVKKETGEILSPTVEAVETNEVKKSPAEIAQKRRENIVSFFKNSKEVLFNKASRVGNNIKSFFGKVKNTSINVALAPDAYVSKGYEKLDAFLNGKADQLETFIKNGVDIAELAAGFVKNRSVENLNAVKDAVVAKYESLKQFGVNAVEAGAEKIAAVKEGVRTKKNNLIIAYLKSIEEKYRQKADRTASTITLLQSF